MARIRYHNNISDQACTKICNLYNYQLVQIIRNKTRNIAIPTFSSHICNCLVGSVLYDAMTSVFSCALCIYVHQQENIFVDSSISW